MTPDLTCQQLVELVTDYLEDALPPEQRARFERHLDTCVGCVTYVEQLRETVRLTGRLREEDVSPAARDTLIKEFRNWQDSPA